MVYAQTRIHPGEWDTQTSLGFCEANGSSNLEQMIRPSDSQQKKRTCQIVNFDVLADHRIKLKESERSRYFLSLSFNFILWSAKTSKYLDLAKEMKKTWNMEVTVIQILIGAPDTVIKGLVKGLEDLEIRGRLETIQTTVLLRLARILGRVLKIWGDLLSLKIRWSTNQQTLVGKNLQGI